MKRSAAILSVLLAGGGLAATVWWVSPSAVGRGSSRNVIGQNSRVVSLSPGVTETLFALGLGNRVVGVTRFCKYPAEAQKLPQVGGFFDPNVEAIVSLKPDVVILLREQEDVGERLHRFGIETIVVDDADMAAVRDAIRTLGDKLAASKSADALLAQIDRQVSEIAERLAGRSRPTVLLCIGRRYGEGAPVDVTGVGQGGLHDEIIELAGGTNVCTSQHVPYPTLSREAIVRMNPEVIIDLTANAESTQRGDDSLRADWDALPHVAAVQSKRVYVLADDAFMIPGPRFVQSLRRFAELLHPEVDWNQP